MFYILEELVPVDINSFSLLNRYWIFWTQTSMIHLMQHIDTQNDVLTVPRQVCMSTTSSGPSDL